ncbi:hypothetical protein RJT34_19370 [Clitoria ternatea]|uniref:Uncharacterized protein n=1 Tax=Clitoria ternatea TaxID=43366 RepID=A0AAN9IR54_CLITE
MEDQRTQITNKQGKKKILPLSTLSIGGEGGIPGLLVFGGALAIAGFVAVVSFTTNKRKTKANHDHPPKPKPQQLLLDEDGCKSQEDHDTILQHEDAKCCWTSNMSINQVESSEYMILVEKSDLKSSNLEGSPTCIHQEILLSDYSSHPESAASSNGSGVTEESSVSLFNNSGDQAQEVEKDESLDGLTSSETDTEDDYIKEDDDEDDDDMTSDEVSEIGSKASLDYNEESVWPAKLIQEPKRRFKGHYSDSQDCSDSDADGSDYLGNEETMGVAEEATLNQKANFSTVLNDQPSELGTWVIPTLLLALLMIIVLLTRRPQESFYVLDVDDGNTVIVDSLK